jgi:hypothetical protein
LSENRHSRRLRTVPAKLHHAAAELTLEIVRSPPKSPRDRLESVILSWSVSS